MSRLSTSRTSFFAAVLVIVAIGLASFVTYESGQTFKQAAENEKLFQEIDRKAVLLFDLSRTLGYGGLIHHFKNYVLRGDPQRLDMARTRLATAKALLNQYGANAPHAGEQQALQRIKSVLLSYEKMFAVAREMVAEGATAQTIDQAVKVDDTAAFEALDFLYENWTSEEARLRTQMINNTREGQRIAALGYALIPILLILGAALVVMIRKLNRAAQHLNEEIERQQRHAQDMDWERQASEEQAAHLAGMAEDLALERQELDRLNQQKIQFFSIVAHDLRSPFTALLGYAGLLSAQSGTLPPEKVTSMAKDLETAAKRAFSLVENLLEWARAQMGTTNFEPEELATDDLGRMAVDQVLPQAGAKKVAIVGTLPKADIYADKGMITMVLRNLLSNAIKFTPEGGTITLGGFLSEGRVVLSITDTGVGIPPATLDKLFDIGQKTSTIGTSGERGTGLGLPLAADFVAANGGQIWVESLEGEGSTFFIDLPLMDRNATDAA
ncbi:MAG: sensor histidine kinase [Rhodospirillales bacterium]